MPNATPECKLLTAYAGHFYKFTCVTDCIIEMGVKDQLTIQPITSSASVIVRTILLFMLTCRY